jgi:type I restriction enzyme R subunit
MSFDVGKGKEASESELPALEQLVNMGYEYKTQAELNRTRKKYSEILLYDRLEEALKRLNPEIDGDGIQDALSQLEESRYPHHLPPVDTNEKIRAKLIGLSQTGGLDPVVVTQNFGDGPEQKVVKIFDFENIDNNDFIVTNQFKVQGFKNPIFPDVMIFVNGIPLVIIECKDPTIPRPIEQAFEKNFTHYQNPGQGYEKLFFYNHCMIATCGTLARVGTLESHINYYARWAEAYPFSEEDVKKFGNGRAREQEILIAGLLSKQNLMNHLQNFVIYETINGQKIKKVGKHQQFRAVSKSMNRLKEDEDIKDKGGVIWHTQGSGKSLSMLWFASQLMYKFGNPPIVIITDRKQLDKQIHETFKSCGFPTPIRAKSGKHLGELLENARGKTIMTIIDKFSTETKIHTDEKVICLVDEAHRSQFKVNAEQMRVAMPNAVFFGFSGTPIDKNDKSVYRVFGPMLDKYGFKESQADGATLPIRYFGKLPELFVEGGDTIEQVFDRVIGQDKTISSEMLEKLKKQYVTKGKIAEAPSRIKRIALDIVTHYTTHIEPNGYKAMIVASSREAAVLYKKELVKLNAPASKIIMTSNLGETGKDDQSWDDYYLSSEQREAESEKFKSADDPTKILIVVDMLLVGYDVPICQVLYLDKGIREHNLLQAIARVNRPYDEPKTFGLIIDYSGITKELEEALEMFEQQDIEGALDPIDDLLKQLEYRHLDVMKYFVGIDRKNYDSIIERFEPIDTREKFEYDFKMFSKALDAVLPDKEADPYLADFKFASEARQLVRTRFDGVKPSIKPYAKKIQQLIDEHIRSLNISNLVNPMEISYENFMAFVKKEVKSDRAKAALIKRRAISVIDEFAPNNPAFYESLRERLERIIVEEAERRKKNADYFANPEEYMEIYQEALSEEKERKKVFGDYEANRFEFALYGELNKKKDRKESIEITKKIFSKISSETELVGWKNKVSVEKNIRAALYEILSEAKFEDEEIDELSEKVLTIAKNDL